jgi:hypothetical protein
MADRLIALSWPSSMRCRFVRATIFTMLSSRTVQRRSFLSALG